MKSKHYYVKGTEFYFFKMFTGGFKGFNGFPFGGSEEETSNTQP